MNYIPVHIIESYPFVSQQFCDLYLIFFFACYSLCEI